VPGLISRDPARHLDAVHDRHADVGQHEVIGRGRGGTHPLQAFVAVARHIDRMAIGAQRARVNWRTESSSSTTRILAITRLP
jgi:hypothetical protein